MVRLVCKSIGITSFGGDKQNKIKILCDYVAYFIHSNHFHTNYTFLKYSSTLLVKCADLKDLNHRHFFPSHLIDTCPFVIEVNLCIGALRM